MDVILFLVIAEIANCIDGRNNVISEFIGVRDRQIGDIFVLTLDNIAQLFTLGDFDMAVVSAIVCRGNVQVPTVDWVICRGPLAV